MASPLNVPQQIEEVILAFDRRTDPFNTHDVQKGLVEARSTTPNPSDKAAFADVLAFALTPNEKGSNPWNTYFGPIGSIIRNDGKTLYWPDIADADPQVLQHWVSRTTDLTNPLLKARYADLAWDMSRAIGRTKPDITMARLAIDSYLACLATDRFKDIYDSFEAAIRALDLAISLNDEQRIDASRAALLKLHDSVIAERKPLWWRAIDRLLNEKNARVTHEERTRFIEQLEDIAQFYSNVADPKAFDPHATESATKRLISFYSRNGRSDDVRRIQQLTGKTFEHFASLGNSMVASSALQVAYNAYRRAGLKDDARRVRIAMEEKIADSRNEMATFSVEHTITKEEMEKFLASIVLPDLAGTFIRIASEFLQSRSYLEKRVTQLAKDAPLMSILSQQLISDNRVAAVVGSVEDDLFGRVIMQAAQEMELADIWLTEALLRTTEVHKVTADHIVTWAARKGLFDDLTLLREGVRAWEEGDYTKAIHILVPQIEKGLRSIAAKVGKPLTKPHPSVKGASVAINMGDILFDENVKQQLGPDLTLHFQALYADPRGFNVRNELTHGLVSPDIMHSGTASRLIHTLLLFGVWEELAKARLKREAKDQ